MTAGEGAGVGDAFHAALRTAEALSRPLEDLPDPLPLAPLPDPFDVSVRPPGSKSLTNRALLLAALAEGESVLRRPLLEARDAELMVAALRRFGAEIKRASGRGDGWRRTPEGSATVEHSRPSASPRAAPHATERGASEALRIRGVAGRPRGAGTLYLENAGTAVRFLAAAAALADEPTIIDGSERMRQRPIAGLASALRALRVRVDFLGEYGYPPLRITPPAGDQPLIGGALHLKTSPSSQFISGLLMIAPWTRDGLHISTQGTVTSPSYVRMTLKLLERLGVQDIEASDDLTNLRVPPGPLSSFGYEVEPDASGATPFWAAAAITPGASCRALGVSTLSLQGDAKFPEALEKMGAQIKHEDESIRVGSPPTGDSLRPISVDLSPMPDAAMTLASVACFAPGATTITGLGTLKVKESDRLAATRDQLRRLGVQTDATDDSLRIAPPPSLASPRPATRISPITLETYDDHRMAMALALIGLRRPGVSIRNPVCVAKTYPDFWRDLARVYASAAAGAGVSDR